MRADDTSPSAIGLLLRSPRVARLLFRHTIGNETPATHYRAPRNHSCPEYLRCVAGYFLWAKRANTFIAPGTRQQNDIKPISV